MEKVLFSTLGMSDPIKNDYDGPLLHILRHYKPSKAYLFMTKRICEFANQDDRYRIQINKLCKKDGFNCEVFELRHEEIDNPQQFDIFYPFFEKELISIYKANPGKEILMNLSSGTPQMKSACNLIAFTSPFPIISIQVTTPNESENYGSPYYDLEESWINNLDNHSEMEPKNRTVRVTSENLRFQFMREAAISNIKAYNYAAALNIICSVKEFVSDDIIRLITAAQHRKNMVLNEAEKESKLAQYDLFPIKTGDIKEIFEYLLLLGIQQKSGQLMDYVRGITPVLTVLFECFLREKCKRMIKRDYCEQVTPGIDHWVLKKDKLGKKDPQLLAYYDMSFKSGFRDSELSCSALLPMIEFDCRVGGRYPNDTIVKKAQDMRNVESKIRNPAAHNIKAIKEEEFVKLAGISSERLLKDMRWLFKFIYSNYFPSGINVWDSYDEMNNHIIDRLKAHMTVV